MVSTGYHDTGEEWAQKNAYRQDLITRNASVDVLLYNDGTDNLTDSSDIGDITTETNDGNYSRQTVNLDTTDFSLSVSNGDVEAELSVSFDVTNSTGTVDALAIIVNFQSDVVNNESTENDHLIASDLFPDGSRDLSNLDTLDITTQISLN